MSTNKGFGIVGIIAVIAIAVVVSLIGWRVYEAMKPSTTSSTNTQQNQTTNNTTTQQTDPNAGYVVIKEWGVRFKAVEGLSGLKTLSRSSSLSGAQEEMLITDDMQKLGPACSGEADGSRPLGAFVRTQTSVSEPSSLQFLKQINNYYFYYYAPSSSCSPNGADEAVQSTNLAKVKQSINSLEAAK